MRRLIKSSFLWQFAGGFAIGAVGLLTLQPASAQTDGFIPSTVEAPLQ